MKFALFAAVAATGIGFGVLAQAVMPGESVDSQKIRRWVETEGSGYRSPEAFRYPYVSTYYVRPTVVAGETQEIRFFVTDFDSSKIRFLDDTFRFTVFLSVSGPKGVKVHTQKGVKSGDGSFDLGKLPVGDYRIALWAQDAKGRESHRVWQEFRVRTAKDLEIPAKAVYRMAEADLEAYGIRNDGDYGRRIEVPVDLPAKASMEEKRNHSRRTIGEYLRENPHTPAKRPGYAVYVPVSDGKIHFLAFERSLVVRDGGYDTNAVERAAVATSDGLQRLLDDKAAAGFRKVVLLPGCYRLSASRALFVPDRMTLDLNGATLKLHEFAGAGACMVNLEGVSDAHLVNGTLEGDYYEHDYAHSPHNSEWVQGVTISGAARYSSVSNVLVKDVTGYGGSNGIGDGKRGKLVYFVSDVGKFVPGGLNAKTGELDARDKYRFTTDYLSLEKAKKFGRLQVSRYLGYQGRATQVWQMTGCWYDANRDPISGETLFQYREVDIPEKAAFLRVSVEAQSVEAAEKASLTLCLFQYPVNCAVTDCTFDRCRCVGYAASAMRNMLFDGNEFRFSGEVAARCAFDAEDGWDQMQDVTLTRNWFHDNTVNNSILTCAGHNFVLERNRCDVHLWGRTHSPCVRDNDIGQATYFCDSRWRSGYGRFEDNRYSKGVRIATSGGYMTSGWDFVLSGLDMTDANTNVTVATDLGGRLLSCRIANRSARVANATACVFENCTAEFIPDGRWYGCSVSGGTFRNFYRTNAYERCTFEGVQLNNFREGLQTFTDCVFRDCTFYGLSAANVRFIRCTFSNTTMTGGYWSTPASLVWQNCKIGLGAKPLLDLGQYTIGSIGFDDCAVTAASRDAGGALFYVSDLRSLKTDDQVGTVVVRRCKFGPGVGKVLSINKKGKDQPKKRIVLRTKDNRLAKGAVLLPPDEKRETWKVEGK